MNPAVTPERPPPPRLDAARIAKLRGCVPEFGPAERSARSAQAVADVTRVMLLAVLGAAAEPLCVTDLVAIIDREQSLVSHHLAVLYRGGLLQRRKRSRFTYYELSERGRAWTLAVSA